MSRTSTSILESLTFIIFLSLGIWLGNNLGNHTPAQAMENIPDISTQPIPALPDGERIILIIGTDKLDTSHPLLESLWLLTYYPDDRPLQWLPIYPSNNNPPRPWETELLDAFYLVQSEGTIHLNPAFLRLLAEHNYWLSGYMLVDTYASEQLIDMPRGLATDVGGLPDLEIISSAPRNSEDVVKALDKQRALIVQVCQSLASSAGEFDWNGTSQLFPEHIITNLDPQQLVVEFKQLTSDITHFNCEFPTLAIAP